MDGYKHFRRDRLIRRGRGITLYVMECFDCFEINDGDNRVECLWVLVKGKVNKEDVMWESVRSPNQDEEAEEIFYKQLGEGSQSLALVLMGDFNLQGVCYKYNTEERKQSRRFLEYVEDYFLTQLVSEPNSEGVPQDLLLVNREGLVDDMKVGGRLEHNDHESIGFSIHGKIRRGLNSTATLDFRRADFGLLRRLVNRVLWEVVLKGK